MPAREWQAEVVIDARLVRRLLRDQFDELELTSLEPLGEGWDNSVWLVDGRWAFRFPRREIAVPAVARQLAMLPRLAPRLPLPIPEPAFAGRPGGAFPWPFFGAPFLPSIARSPAERGKGPGSGLVRQAAGLSRFGYSGPAVARSTQPRPRSSSRSCL